jgi:scyllo-inositol 2-dehydrogenase (NADP+)
MQKIRTALLAYGASGKSFHAPLLDACPSFELVGALERSSEKMRKDYPSTKTYASIEELLSDSIDLVIVNTPNFTHHEFARLCLEKGKHVVLEKPMTLTAAEGKDLKHLAEKQKLCLSVFQNRRWDSDFLTVKKVLGSDVLGRITNVEIHFDRFRPEPGSKAHKEGNLPGAGIHYDIGPHLIDQALQLFGQPLEVSADLRYLRKGALAVDEMSIAMHYPSFRARLLAGFLTPSPGDAYIISGEFGSLRLRRTDAQESLLTQGIFPGNLHWQPVPPGVDAELLTRVGGVEESKKVPLENGNYMCFYNHLANAILKSKALPVTADEGVAVVEIIEAAIKSDSEKKAVKLN